MGKVINRMALTLFLLLVSATVCAIAIDQVHPKLAADARGFGYRVLSQVYSHVHGG